MTLVRLPISRTPIARSSLSIQIFSTRRSFSRSSRFAVGKETELHEEDRASRVEAEKQEKVKKAQEGRDEWDSTLSSESEDIVKADRGEMKNAKDTIAELQQETAKEAEREKRENGK